MTQATTVGTKGARLAELEQVRDEADQLRKSQN